MKRPWVILGILLAVVALASWVELKNRPGQLPDIALTSLEGESIALADLQSQPVLVTFWATSCSTCMRDMPHLVELHQELQPLGLQIIAVAMAYDPPDRVLALYQKQNYPFRIALDPLGHISRAFGDIQATPTWFLAAPDGEILVRKTGPLDPVLIRKQVMATTGSAKVSLR